MVPFLDQLIVPLLAQARTATALPGDVVTLSWSSVFAISGVISIALTGLVAYMKMSIMLKVNMKLAMLETTLAIVQRATQSNPLAGPMHVLVEKVGAMEHVVEGNRESFESMAESFKGEIEKVHGRITENVSDIARLDERSKG